MNKPGKKEIVLKNVRVTFFTMLLQTLLEFIARKLFIRYLGVAYLGYNSVFSNILQMLNLADLGVGTAITSFLYAPLVQDDQPRIRALMYLYRRIYRLLGFLVIALGLVISLFLTVLIPDSGLAPGTLRLYFYIQLAGTASTYFLAYKRTLLIADQRSYLTYTVDTVITMLFTLLQIAAMVFLHSYVIYLVLTVVRSLAANLILSARSDRLYGSQKSADPAIVESYKPQLVSYVKDLFLSKIGAYVFYGTDNVIISVFRGSLLAGYLSNYTMITGRLNSVIIQVLSSVQATYGQYINSGADTDSQRKMTDYYLSVNFLIGNFCMICFALLAQPFIATFFGQKLLLDFSTAVWLGVNLMLSMLIQLPGQVFTIYRLRKYDKLIVSLSAVLNILISILLVRSIGVDGALIGTFVTSLIYLFSRFYIISQMVYHVPYRYYLLQIAKYALISVSSFAAAYFTAGKLDGNGLLPFAGKAVCVAAVAGLSTVALLSFTGDFSYVKERFIPHKLHRFASAPVLCVLCLSVMALVYMSGAGIPNTLGNKSYDRSETYPQEASAVQEKTFHYSLDDTLDCFEDLTQNNYNSIFENATFQWLRSLHETYGTVTTCYCYYENDHFSLAQAPDSYRQEFSENSDWLKFGFHARTPDSIYKDSPELLSDYEAVVRELKRIAGDSSIDHCIRLHYYSCSREDLERLTQAPEDPVVCLLTADDRRISYCLSETDSRYIYCHDYLRDAESGCVFVSTDLRAEYIENAGKKIRELQSDAWNNQRDILILFGHEWALSPSVQHTVEKLCDYAQKNDYAFQFLEDVGELHLGG